MGLGISEFLPHLGQVSSFVSSYSREPAGWFALSAASYLARAAIAVVLLTPITLLMGGTLTLLIRHLVRSNLSSSGWRIALLYSVNTAGAAFGCFLTDFTLVPAIGLQRTQMIAAGLNGLAGVGALYMSSRAKLVRRKRETATSRTKVRLKPDATTLTAPLILTSLALAMTGFAAMGIKILQKRHFSMR